jgi:hypothetical protein
MTIAGMTGKPLFRDGEGREKVDKHRLTQVGRAMKEFGVQMIAAYSPQARGRSERSFGPGKVGCRRNSAWRGSPQ